jgi:hypothetical protein
MNREPMEKIPPRDDLPSIRPFERLSMLMKNVLGIARLSSPDRENWLRKRSPYAKSAFNYGCASDIRQQEGNKKAIEILTTTIASDHN